MDLLRDLVLINPLSEGYGYGGHIPNLVRGHELLNLVRDFYVIEKSVFCAYTKALNH